MTEGMQEYKGKVAESPSQSFPHLIGEPEGVPCVCLGLSRQAALSPLGPDTEPWASVSSHSRARGTEKGEPGARPIFCSGGGQFSTTPLFQLPLPWSMLVHRKG